MKRKESRIWALLLLSFIVSVISHIQMDKLVRNSISPESAAAFIPNVQAAKMFSLGFDQLVADCYWLSFIGYIGNSQERIRDRYSLADEYLTLIVGLDPYLVNAYWFAAFAIGSEQKSPERAAEIIDFGIRTNQDNWYLPFIAGINQYLYNNDELRAAKYYRKASTYPGAPEWLKRQAEILEAKIPSKIKEINTWTNIYTSDADERVKEMARHKLIDLWGQILASRPPQKVRDKAQEALKSLGADIGFYLKHFKHASQPKE